MKSVLQNVKEGTTVILPEIIDSIESAKQSGEKPAYSAITRLIKEHGLDRHQALKVMCQTLKHMDLDELLGKIIRQLDSDDWAAFAEIQHIESWKALKNSRADSHVSRKTIDFLRDRP